MNEVFINLYILVGLFFIEKAVGIITPGDYPNFTSESRRPLSRLTLCGSCRGHGCQRDSAADETEDGVCQ